MSQKSEIERRQEEAEAHLRARVMNEFCATLRRTGLPPMAVLRLAAQAVGSVYREVSDTHSGPDACPCGWYPRDQDIEVMCMALVAASRATRRRTDLRSMQVVGSA